MDIPSLEEWVSLLLEPLSACLSSPKDWWSPGDYGQFYPAARAASSGLIVAFGQQAVLHQLQRKIIYKDKWISNHSRFLSECNHVS